MRARKELPRVEQGTAQQARRTAEVGPINTNKNKTRNLRRSLLVRTLDQTMSVQGGLRTLYPDLFDAVRSRGAAATRLPNGCPAGGARDVFL
ncbi:hypothetical protein NDU88_001999 [Pleurodeles waltl]|uniref:Uncharacterized protein n=1 Tax=Pleurodeles waltl TaxID=8319 RepID=A0AAV7QBP7_PLEWA|nr:hypothetical protein NDU88_001999 [Pleurodeles waltl]